MGSTSFLDIANAVAVVAQAMTAALAAGRRRLDWFGVASLGCVTALGGGSIRDVVLGHYPLSWVAQPWLLLLAAAAALATIPLARVVRRMPMTFLILDALGLVVFTVIGCNVAVGLGHGTIVAMVCGMATGCTGGVIRDMLCGDVPLVLRGELYATVALLTGGLYVTGLALGWPIDEVMLGAMCIGFGVRMLAIRHAWRLPTFALDDELKSPD
ncbi:MAG: trimeric intracellular cation channel family protein [Pseudomonadota bacterium]